jgi:hypothetical protein
MPEMVPGYGERYGSDNETFRLEGEDPSAPLTALSRVRGENPKDHCYDEH